LLVAAFLALAIYDISTAQETPARPKITGIDHVRFYVTDFSSSQQFYEKLFGVRVKGGTCFATLLPCFTVGWEQNQQIELKKAPTREMKNRIAEISFATSDVKKMRKYLSSNGISVGPILKDKSPGDKEGYDAHFEVHDPQGNAVSFIQRFAYPVDDPSLSDPWYVRMIHTGFVVKDRAATEHFYKDILGFRPYWHGGMKDDQTDWVSLQVPDGTDWVEFMVNVSPTADHHTLGVMNHIALGVPDIQAAKAQLIKNGWKSTEEPKIGRDGKWQLNLYDPDETRVEFMEFTPTRKPCCSEFTGPHPGPPATSAPAKP
jgi:catechol 2,3-dioxygenase-like lactoylglutathione lyase family enzyme